MNGLPDLNESRCIGCGDCVRVCPTACLVMPGHFPTLPRPGDCVFCALCVTICPTAALHLTQTEPEA